ncbi:helix-turn-helix transcriptional regulator [Nocardioides ferulae]|uniref:helix-turn-helix transcriptional regulator n=1 Tax=Nocardioides ferulae TaxID=2340821 RepID=UPI0013DE50A5|nr:AAA family ATPase [Nocardioides ferulae]
MAAHTSGTLVGRDTELAQLAELLGVGGPEVADPTVAGYPARRPGAVLLSGDAGVGKTRLLMELRDLAVGAGWQVCAGHCLDFGDSALPYLPFSEVLGRVGAELPGLLDEVADRHPALARLLPGRRVLDGGAAMAADADEAALDRGDLFEAMHALLEAAAAKAPLLLVVEDLHWADRSTRDLLTFLFRRPFAGPVSLVASYRSDDLHRRHPLRRQVAEWSRVHGVERVQLSPLGDEAVRALVAELVPGGLSADEVEGVVARAEGNAFFVEELISAVSEPGRWVPPDLADVLLVRLDRLDDIARQVVRAASVGGRRVSHELLVAAVELSETDLDHGLRRAVEMNILVAGEGSYAFRHALLGEAVYDDLLPGERVRLHARYAEALRSRTARGTAAELARHARLAHDHSTAVVAAVQAGDEASAVGGPEEAADHYQQALEQLADPRLAVEVDLDVSKVAVSAVEALTACGHPARAAALAAEHLRLLPADAPPVARARILSARASALAVMDNDEDPLALSRAALGLVPDDLPRLRAKVLAAHARILAGSGAYDEAQTVGLEALGLAERHGLGDLVSDAVTTLSGLKKAGPKEALRKALTEAVARAEESGAIHAELRGRYFLARSFGDWAELDEAARWFDSAVQRGIDSGLPWAPYAFEARWQLAWVRFVRGEWDDVLALTDCAGGAAPPVLKAMLDAVRLTVLHGRGHDVSPELAALRRFWPVESAVPLHASTLEMVSAARRGDPAGALTSYDDAVAVLTRIWDEWFSARIRLAAVAAGAVARTLPRLPAAQRPALLERVEQLHRDGHTVLERYADPSGHWGPEGQAWMKRLDAETLRVRWLVGVDAPPAESLVEVWREAETLFADFGHLHELARVRAVLAGVLRATGDQAGSRAVADQARATALALGARPLVEELRALGAAPVRGDATSTGLTTREREILGLVAEGRSNGEIARQLYISAKTVSVHVSNILGKLGAAGRTEAAAIARRDGLLD